MAADKRLRGLPALPLLLVIVFFVIILYLRQLRLHQRRCDLCVTVAQVMPGQFLQISQLPIIDVVALVLSKAVEEHAALRDPIGDDRARTAGPSAARSCDTLLDKMTAEIGIDRTALGARDRLAQAPVVESLLTGEARKHPGHKYAHASSGFQSSIPLGVIMQGRRTIGVSEFSSQSKSTSVLRASCSA